MFQSLFVDPWPFWAGGLAIGLLVTAFALVMGKGVGISSGFCNVCNLVAKVPYYQSDSFQKPWRLWFIVGVPLGAMAAAMLAGTFPAPWEIATFDREISASAAVRGVLFFAGGVCIGFGSRWAGGCTSGHAIVGIAQGALSSLLATAGFMIGGFGATALLYGVFGGSAV